MAGKYKRSIYKAKEYRYVFGRVKLKERFCLGYIGFKRVSQRQKQKAAEKRTKIRKINNIVYNHKKMMCGTIKKRTKVLHIEVTPYTKVVKINILKERCYVTLK